MPQPTSSPASSRTCRGASGRPAQPRREAVFEAVCRREVQHLADLAEALLTGADPVLALRRWMRGNVDFVATMRGMSAALATAAGHASPDLIASPFGRLFAAVGALLDRAVQAGRSAAPSGLRTWFAAWSGRASSRISQDGSPT